MIAKATEGQQIVGTVVLVAHKGEIVYHRAAGKSDRERSRLMREDDIFRLASVTKPIVSVAVMKSIEQGKLDLQTPVTRWLPEFKPRELDGSTPTISIHQLLTHTAGLSYGFMEPLNGPYHRAGVSDGLDMGIPMQENLRRISSVPLTYSPGTGWRYSVAMDVLGAAISAATESSLPELVHKQVTGPLGMADTGFSVVDSARLVTPYQDGGTRPLRMTSYAEVAIGEGSIRFNPDRVWDTHAYPSGGAGMVGTAGDFMKLLLSLRPDSTHRVLKPETVALMMRNHTEPQVQTLGPGWGFGYGWAILTNPELARTPQGKGTIQWGGAYGHSWFYDPVYDIAVVALTNTAIEGMSGAFPQEVRDAVYVALNPKRL
ncbi:serine hydrolase domain-containing protein [Serratia fonticola]|uniref:serine hydrolase domain-containing protein n=1 Tax=Serratia fonticola TaxID=47917 RepID=UPI0021AD8903|nr:serine hydrolase domain-containing protein [Serratia fonticola]